MGFFDSPGVDSFDDNGVMAIRVNDALGGYTTGETAEQRLQRLKSMSGPTPTLTTPEASPSSHSTEQNQNVQEASGYQNQNVQVIPTPDQHNTSQFQVGDVSGPARTAMDYFVGQGWSPHQAAGIVGSLQQESYHSLKTDVQGDNNQAYGIAQWHGDRQAQFQALYGKPIQGSSLEEQLAFVQWELQNTEKAAGNNLRNSQNAAEAATVMGRDYERAGILASGSRAKNAQRLLKSAPNPETDKGGDTVSSNENPVQEHGILQLAAMTSADSFKNYVQPAGWSPEYRKFLKDMLDSQKPKPPRFTDDELLDESKRQRDARDRIFLQSGTFIPI